MWRKHRRVLLILAAITVTAFAFSASAAIAGTDAQRPNIVLILADDLGWADVSFGGSTFYETPHIDALAKRGMRFTNFYAAAPICSPTRASIMTGKAPARLWITTPAGHLKPLPGPGPHFAKAAPPGSRFIYPLSKRYLEPDEYTLAEALREAGYATAHVGKWHLGVNPEHWPERQGFQVSFHGAPDPGPSRSYFSPYQFKAGTVTSGPPGEYITDRVTDEAVKFISANRDRPFFLYLPHYAVHGPWQGKKKLVDYYSRKAKPDGHQRNPVNAAMIHSLDENVGRLLIALDDLELTERTVVVFTSDNGGLLQIPRRRSNEESPNTIPTEPITTEDGRVVGVAVTRTPDVHITSNKPLRGGKGMIYEGGFREPAVFLWPGVTKPGSVCHTPAISTDLYATLLEIAGVKPRPGTALDGLSLMPLLKSARPPDRDALYWHFPHGNEKAASVIREGDWKLIHFYETGDELYNLRDDVGETTNLAEKMPDKTNALRTKLMRWLKDVGAVMPKPNPQFVPPGMWIAQKDCTAEMTGGLLRVESTGVRPVLVSRDFKIDRNVVVHLRMKTTGTGNGLLYWANSKFRVFVRERRAEFKLNGDGQFHEYAVPLEAEHGVTRLRLDPGRSETPIEIDWIRVTPADGDTILKQWEFQKEQ